MADKTTGNQNVSSDFLKVLMALKSNIMKDLNVAEIAIVSQKNGDEINCYLLNDNNVRVVCISLHNVTVNEGDIVLIIFTNTDFRTNLKKYKQNRATYKVEADTLHSKNYGVIIGKI